MCMGEFVTLTRQGQITIPAKFRRALGFEKQKKLFLIMEKDRLVIEPPSDIFALEGIFADKAIKGKPIQEIIRMEHEAAAEAAAEDYVRKLKRIQKSFPKK